MEEVSGVLGRKFGWSEGRSTQAIQMLRDAATVVEPRQIPAVVEGNEFPTTSFWDARLRSPQTT